MIERPTFKSHFRAECLPGEGVMVLSERGQTLLRGRLYESVAPLIDGRRSADEIAQQLQDAISPAEVYHALRHLEKRGYLTGQNGHVPEADEGFWHLQKIEPATAARQLQQTTVAITSFGDLDSEPLAQALGLLRVRVEREGELGLVVTDDYLRSGLDEYNRQALRASRPWMLVKAVGSEIWVGPMFQPGHSACWECLAARLRGNREAEVFVQLKQRRSDPVPVPLTDLPATRAIAWNLTALEIAKWIALGNSRGENGGLTSGAASALHKISQNDSLLEGRLLTLDTLTWKTQWHTVVRWPQCPACGNPNWTREPGIVLQSHKKTFTQDGGHRAASPTETLGRYEHHVSRLTGAVTMLERFPCSDGGVVNVYGAGHNAARRQTSLDDIRRGLRSHSAGKGATDLQARASALCEALERHSGIFRGDEPRTKPCRLRDLGEAGIHPNLCLQYSDKQYRERATLNELHSSPTAVPEPFDEEQPVEWTPLWSLTRKQVRYLPTGFCYYGYAMEKRYCRACSNGNAAGNTLEEAIVQGFFELVERDAVALWWYNRVARPGVDLESFEEPYLRQLRQCLRDRQHRDLWVLDLTSDLRIPVFAALSRRIERESEEILIGFGAHFDARIALLRAVTELNQALAWVWTGTDGQRLMPEGLDDPETNDWLATATRKNQPYLVPAESPRRVLGDFPQCSTDDVRDDVLACQALVEQHGLEMLVLNQTRPEIGLPVVKVVVPGLRHFWPRLAPGRLYDTPVKLGWLTQPRREEELNPIAIFF
jgi:ribosomal protein S12 methylthiotransferase accessory factor